MPGLHTISSLGTTSNTLSGNITINNTSSFTIVFNNSGATGSGTTFTVGGATPNSSTIDASTYANVISLRASFTGKFGILNSRINTPNATVNANNYGLWTINSTGNTWASMSFSNAGSFILGANDALATRAYQQRLHLRHRDLHQSRQVGHSWQRGEPGRHKHQLYVHPGHSAQGIRPHEGGEHTVSGR